MRKTFAVALVVLIAASTLGVAISSTNAMGSANRGWGWNWGTNAKNGDTISFQRSWIRLNGIVEGLTGYEDEVTGSLSANARTVGAGEGAVQKAFATAIWRTAGDKTPDKDEDSWTSSFYSARLVTVDESSLGLTEGNPDYVLTGTWKVVHVTITHTETKTEDAEGGYTINRQTTTKVESIEEEAPGTLTVTEKWSKFVLLVEGTKTDKDIELTGSLTRTRMSQMTFNRFKISEDETDTVSRVDLKTLAKNLRARVGWGSYDSNMDFNCNYKIDIADLATVAANVESD